MKHPQLYYQQLLIHYLLNDYPFLQQPHDADLKETTFGISIFLELKQYLFGLIIFVKKIQKKLDNLKILF